MNPHNDIAPPRWPLKCLRFFLKKEYLEEIEGDMEEVFIDNVSRIGFRKARNRYTWEMLRLLRPNLLRNMEAVERLNQYGMLKNYFKVSIRGLMKYPLNSSINIVGLAVAIGIAVFAYGFARWTFSTDQFHEYKDEVYLVTFFANREGIAQQYGITPRPLGEMLRNDFAAITRVCRVEDRNAVVKHDDDVYHERIRLTDPEFLQMLTFPMKWGTAQSLADVNSIILSEEMSIKYFGEENPVGQTVLLKFGHEDAKAFKVTAVAAKFPEARTISFSFLINIDNVRTADPGYDFQDWKSMLNATLIQVPNPSDAKWIEQQMEKYRKFQHEAVNEDWAISTFTFEPLATLHKRSGDIRDDISRSSGDNYKSVVYLCIIGALMLMLACFNYINIAILSAAKRLKEIGVRKSIGATRGIVIFQFLAENVLITFFALLLGLALGAWLFIPWFEQQWHFNMGFRFTDANLWIYLPMVLLVTGIASGIYPALFISRFQVVGILKGFVKFGNKSFLTKVLLGFQLMLACIFMSISILFTQNNSYLANRSWGYNQMETMYAVVPDGLSYAQLQTRMLQNPDVISVAGSVHHLGRSNGSRVLHFPDREVEADQYAVEAKYFETMGLQLKKGRFFNDYDGSDRQAVVVNETLVKNLGWREAVGQRFEMDSVTYEVVGVVREFHSYSFFKPIRSTIFTVAGKDAYHYLSLRARPASEMKVFSNLRASWLELFPETPFEGGYQEDAWGSYYEATRIYNRVWSAFSFMAILLATLGLYGLVTLNVSSRTREFSIRKVLGAGISNLTGNIMNQYVVLFLIALLIGSPLSYWASKFLLDSVYTVHMPVTFTGAVVAGSMLILVLLLTVSTQITKVAKASPVEGLKSE